jgi:hypothetical protein
MSFVLLLQGLFRVRGDCYMALLQPKSAEKDYAQAIQYLQVGDNVSNLCSSILVA